MRTLLQIILPVFLLSGQALFAQTKTVVGKIIDSKDGMGLPGVSIIANGTKSGTVTKNDGTFSLSTPENVTQLTVSIVGYETQNIAITDAPLTISLKESGTRSLDEIVVVGFGTKIKKDLTGNIAQIKGSEIANTPVSNFNQALQGRAAGVFVEANNGKVGEGVKIRIRGSGSISASNSPLYVVDGVPLSNDAISGNALADINFNDVETFDILKDASAAAIFGSRAANGVVLITTKKGKQGKTLVNANAQFGFNDPTNYRGFLNAKQYVDLLREAAINSDNLGGVDPLDPAQYSDSWLEFAEGRLTRYSGHSDWKTLQTNTNWEKLAFNSESTTKIIDISASGGTDKTRFYASGSYNDQDGILVGNYFQRLSGRINLEHEASAKLKLGINLSLSRTLGNRVAADNAFSTPLQLVALAPITPVRDLNAELYDRPVTTYYNGLIELENGSSTSTTIRNIGNIFLNYKLHPNLVFKSEFGIDLHNQNDELFSGSKTEVGISVSGYAQSDWQRVITYNTNNYFTFTKEFAKILDFDATAGVSYQKYSSYFASVNGNNFPGDVLQTLASAGQITGGTSTRNESAILSYFARTNYKLNNKYLLSLSGRIDGLSRVSKKERYGFFPSASLGWILSEEDFLKSSRSLSFLKIRGSFGLTGNADGFGDFSYLPLYGVSKYNKVAGLVPAQLENPNFKWEKSEQLDLGIDFGFFNNRISGELDYYIRNTRDLIYDVPVPGTSGFTTQTVNIGSMQNKGIEIVLNSTNVRSKNFTWNSSFNLSKNKNKITKLDGDQTIIPGNDGRFLNSLIVGQSIGVFYGPKYAGVDSDNGDALFYKADGKTTTTDYNESGNFIVGDPNPDWIAGLSNNFNFKGIELNVLLQGVFGNQIQNGAGGFMSANFDWFDNQTIDQLHRWQKKGDVTNVPQLRLGAGNGIAISSRYVENGSYVRVKNITLAYNFSAKTLSILKLRSARFYITAVNFATFTKYNGWDPEVNADYRAGNRNQGSDFYSAPQIKTITVGFNLGL